MPSKNYLQDTTRSYKTYLTSTEWQEKRKVVLERDKHCQCCDSTDDLIAHHLTYEHIFDEPLEDLIALCKKCHLEEHPEIIKSE